MKTVLQLLGVLALVLLAHVHAAEPDAPSSADTRQMLLQGKFADLDQRFGAIQAAYVAGKITDEDLRAAFRVFYSTDPSLEVAYANWVAQSPKSYVAHLARGIYYKMTGIELRGRKSSGLTTAKQFADLRAAHAIASQEFEASLKLDRKPLLTYLHYIDVYTYQGDQKRGRELFDRGVAIDPKTFIMREKYLGALETRWGGSTAEMREFVEECRAAGLTQNQMARLHSIVRENEASVLQFDVGDLDGAVKAYGEAALLNPERACANCGPNYRRAQIFAEQKQYAKSIEVASEVLRAHPENINMLNLRGFCYVTLGKGSEAQADFLRSANLGDAWAQTEYAKLLLNGDLIPANRKEAIRWLTLAADKGFPEAIKILPKARDPNLAIGVKP